LGGLLSLLTLRLASETLWAPHKLVDYFLNRVVSRLSAYLALIISAVCVQEIALVVRCPIVGACRPSDPWIWGLASILAAVTPLLGIHYIVKIADRASFVHLEESILTVTLADALAVWVLARRFVLIGDVRIIIF